MRHFTYHTEKASKGDIHDIAEQHCKDRRITLKIVNRNFSHLAEEKKALITKSKAGTYYSHSFKGHIQMNWEIDYVKDKRIVKVKPSGQRSRDDTKRFSEETLVAGRKKNVNAFLLDQKETAFGFSVLEMNRLPSVLRDIGFSVRDRMAVLINHDSLKSGAFRFLQDVLSLSSLQIQVFNDTEEATAWLKAQPRKHAKPAFES